MSESFIAVRFNPLCRALGLQPLRVEQWVARGLFEPQNKTTPGKAREWTAKDARALLVFDALYSRGMPAVQASQLSHMIHRWKDDKALLVAWPDPLHNNGGWRHEIVRNRAFNASKFAEQEKILSLVTVPLNRLADVVKAAFDEALSK